jgi:ribose/xylose/arabinose/galactoside ABC-type transport system permease subunit
MKNKISIISYRLISYTWIILIFFSFLIFFFPYLNRGALYVYLQQTCLYSFAAAGTAMFFLTGEINLAAGGQVACAVVLLHWFTIDMAVPFGFSCLILLLASVVLGLAYSFLSSRLHIQAIYFTFASQTIFTGLAFFVFLHTKGNNLTAVRFSVWSEKFLRIPLWILLWPLLFGFIWWLLWYTRPGRSFPVLGRAAGADIAGMETNKIKRGSFVLGCLLITLSAVLFYMRTGTGSQIDGNVYSYNILAALGLGSLRGIKSRWMPVCVLAGSAGLVMLHALWQYWSPPFSEMIINGIILISCFFFAQREEKI